MNKFLLSFRRIFEQELLKIQHADEKKSELFDQEIVNSMLDENSVVTSAKSYIKRQEPQQA
ncbi:hypothetical protein [Acinetobacter variabilis]|uniref:hypothetical protein n=1 Tax=Acinetobacter variabilis TaxID=70346 RepID=UPI00133049CE|nr:hypothetical protein [Acinetobacter variabilis]